MLVRVNEGISRDCLFNDRLDRPLLRIGHRAQYDLSSALDQAEDGMSFSIRPRPGTPANLRHHPGRPLLSTAVD